MAPQTYQKWPHNDGDYLPPHPWMHYIRSQGLPYVQFFKYLLTYCAMDRSSLFQTSPLLSEAWNSWRIILTSKDWSREGTEYLGLFHVHFQQFPCPVQQQAHVFSTLPFAADTETLLFILDPQQILATSADATADVLWLFLTLFLPVSPLVLLLI